MNARNPRYALGETLCTLCGDHAPVLEAPGGAHADPLACVIALKRRAIRAERELAALKAQVAPSQGAP